MEEKIISLIRKYVIAFALMGIATGFVLWIREYSAKDAIDIVYLNLADAFTIPSVIMLMSGVLVWLSSQGLFDMLGYGFSRAKETFIPSPVYKHEQFYDYKVRKDAKRAKGYGFMFVAGGIYFIPAIVFNVLYACL